MNPRISVLMPVHNGLPYLEDAVESVLNQGFQNFEFIIINDGSNDGTKETLEYYRKVDGRIRLFHQKNRGVALSLNRGLKEARGKYIARMDADDITAPTRLRAEYDFLESHPDVGIVGTQVQKIDGSGKLIGKWELPTEPDTILWELLFRPTFCHPSIMARHDLLKDLGGYAEWATHAEDYELWTRAVQETALVNLPDVLHSFRKWEDSVTANKLEQGIQTCCQAAAELHRDLLGQNVSVELPHFLVRQWFENTPKAYKKTTVGNIKKVYKYIHNLYKKYSKITRQNTLQRKPRSQAIKKRLQIAKFIGNKGNKKEKIWYTIKAPLLEPIKEILPWMKKEIKKQITKNTQTVK